MTFKAVVGFAFTPSLNKVLLIKKNRPEWQAGWLNGVGGKIEGDESPIDAMRREFKEETGLDRHKWNHYATLLADDNTLGAIEISVFRTITSISKAIQTTDEELVRFNTNHILKRTSGLMHNLKWLLPMAMYDSPVKPVEFWIGNLPNDWHLTKQVK